MGKCNLCKGNIEEYFTHKVLGEHLVTYYYCDSCGLLQTQKPFWLEQAYSSAICASDTGLVSRNIALSRQLIPLLRFLFSGSGQFVDLAGGTGLLVRLMRDAGYEFFWEDPYCANVHAIGFDYDGTSPCKAVTAFEVMEHLEDPLGFVKSSLEKTSASAFLFSTSLYSGKPPRPEDWWYYGFDSGQHIAFYQDRTLQYIATELNMHYYSSSGMHMFSAEPVSPTLYSLCTGRIGRALSGLVKKFSESFTKSDSDRIIQKARRLMAPEASDTNDSLNER